MELYQVGYFLALARTLNFTRAAEHCNVTQPALTKAIQKLELELGGDLIHRERQFTQLTDLGKLVIPMLERSLEAANTARAQAKKFRSKEIAPIRIGLTALVSASVITELLSELAAAVEGTTIDLVDCDVGVLEAALLEGHLHAAFGTSASSRCERIDAWPLFSEGYVVLMSPTHPFAAHDEIPADILGDALWLEYDGLELDRLLRPVCGNGPQIVHHGGRWDHLQYMALAQLGVLLAPGHVPYAPGLSARTIQATPLTHEVALMAVAGRRYAPALDALIKLARRRCWSADESTIRDKRSDGPVSATFN